MKQLRPFQASPKLPNGVTSGKAPALPLPLDLTGEDDAPDEDDGEIDIERPAKRLKTDASGEGAGKTTGKGTKPRTMVRGVRGVVEMEVDDDGNERPVVPADGEIEDVAKRPELGEEERRRRTEKKEREKQREEEVVRRLTQGANVDADVGEAESGLSGQKAVTGEVEVWEGLEFVSADVAQLTSANLAKAPCRA